MTGEYFFTKTHLFPFFTKLPLPQVIPHPHSIPSISTGQREPSEGAEPPDSLSSAPQPPKQESSDGDFEISRNSNGDLVLFCVFRLLE